MKQYLRLHNGRTNILVEYIKELRCNKCGCRMTPDNHEYHDMMHWEDTGGYASYFGDGTKLSLTLCAPCLDLLVGNYIIKEYYDVG